MIPSRGHTVRVVAVPVGDIGLLGGSSRVVPDALGFWHCRCGHCADVAFGRPDPSAAVESAAPAVTEDAPGPAAPVDAAGDPAPAEPVTQAAAGSSMPANSGCVALSLLFLTLIVAGALCWLAHIHPTGD